jgi:hypothetical protein
MMAYDELERREVAPTTNETDHPRLKAYARRSLKAGRHLPTLRRLSPFGSGASLRALDNALEILGQRRIVVVHCRMDTHDVAAFTTTGQGTEIQRW